MTKAVLPHIPAEELHAQQRTVIVDQEHQAEQGPQLANDVNDSADQVVHDANAWRQIYQPEDEADVDEARSGPYQLTYAELRVR